MEGIREHPKTGRTRGNSVFERRATVGVTVIYILGSVW